MLPTGTVTFLFTDIQGSTPLWDSEPEKMAAALEVHHSALRQAIETHSGVVFKTVGDAFLPGCLPHRAAGVETCRRRTAGAALRSARDLQAENPLFEPVFQHLLYLYVLNGSRLDALKTVDRRLRGLVDGQGALILVSGVSGIGKTSMIMAFEERVHALGVEIISVRCNEHEKYSYAMWQDVAHETSSVTGVSLDSLPAPIGKGSEVESLGHLRKSLDSLSRSPLLKNFTTSHWDKNK